MRQRTFEIIRVPEKEGTSFLFNNVEVCYVGTCPQTGISFYCSIEQTYGVRVYPDGRKMLENACGVKHGHTEYSHGKAEYLYFRNAFGNIKGICASHAVWMAAGRTIKPGMTMDHINGDTTNNHLSNLRCISSDINIRDGGFLTKLSNKNINPTTIHRSTLLRYFARMAFIKANVSKYRYGRLDRDDLMTIVFYDLPVVYDRFEKVHHISLPFTTEIM